MRRVIQNGESFPPAINMCECHITNQNSYNSPSFLFCLRRSRTGQGRVTGYSSEEDKEEEEGKRRSPSSSDEDDGDSGGGRGQNYRHD